MAEYRRFVAYIYEYVNGIKGENAGFVKVESRNGVCRIQLHLQAVPAEETSLQVDGFVRTQNHVGVIPLGMCRVKGKTAEFKGNTPHRNFGNSDYSLDQIAGMFLEGENGSVFATAWDNEPIDVDELKRFAKNVHMKQKAAVENNENPETGKAARGEKVSEFKDSMEKLADAGDASDISEKEETDAAVSAQLNDDSRLAEESSETAVPTAAHQGNAGEMAGFGRRTDDWNLADAGGRTDAGNLADTGGRTDDWNLADAGGSSDAGNLANAGGVSDAGNMADAGVMSDAGNMADAGVMSDAGKVADARIMRDSEETSFAGVMADAKEAASSGGMSGSEELSAAEGRSDSEMLEEKGAAGSGEVRESNGFEAGEVREASIEAGADELNSGEADGGSDSSDGMVGESAEADENNNRNNNVGNNIRNNVRNNGYANNGYSNNGNSNGYANNNGYSNNRNANNGNQVHMAQAQARGRQQASARCNMNCANSGLDRKWDQFQCHYPPMEPFTDDEIVECIRIAPKDIMFLRRDDQRFARNNFLLQSFYNYQHLMLGRLRDGGYVLGVPGLYENQERFMANMFGFMNFKEARPGKQENFGYWLRPVR